MDRPILHTEMCDLLDIEYPIALAGMGPTVGGGQGGIAGPELVAAVSNAGGLGVLGAAGFPPDRLEEQIRRIQDLTDRPFGVDILVPSNVAPRPSGRTRPKRSPRPPARRAARRHQQHPRTPRAARRPGLPRRRAHPPLHAPGAG